MKITAVKDAIARPRRAARYAFVRLHDVVSGRQRFKYASITSSETIPEFSRECYIDVSLLQSALNGASFERSLEVGSGFGKFTPWIADYSDEHYVVELEENLLKKTMETEPLIDGKVEFRQGALQDLPHDDGAFDLIVVWTVLEHIPPEDVQKAIDEIKRVLSSDGVAIVTDQTEGYDDTGLGPLPGKMWVRSIEEYERMFEPLSLTWKEPRHVEGYRKTGYGATVMRFEQ